jgi:hypothetical protein
MGAVKTMTDSIPRIQLPDLFIALKEFEHEPVRSLEELRLKICANRQKSPSGDRNWATARDNAVELERLGLITATSFPKDRRAYEAMRDNKARITDEGQQMLKVFKEDRADAYDRLFFLMFEVHPYLQAYVRVLMRKPLWLPVVTSAREHVSERYASATSLVRDVSQQEFDIDGLCANLGRRLQRALTQDEINQIRDGTWKLLQEWSSAATMEEPPLFAKKLLQKLNDVVLPALLRLDGLEFDFKTHQSLWSFGNEWRLWESTAQHPGWDLRLVFKTASIMLSSRERKVEKVVFDSGLEKTRINFLDKLFATYQKLQQMSRGTFAIVDELRAVFCYDNACQESVFDRLVSEHYVGSENYELNMEVYRKGGQHNRPIRIGNRNIGLIRVVRH